MKKFLLDSHYPFVWTILNWRFGANKTENVTLKVTNFVGKAALWPMIVNRS